MTDLETDAIITTAKLRLQCLKNAFMAGASSRRHFPPEVLFMIFQVGFDTSDFGDMFAYNVASVCKYWYDVASSWPKFWSTVEIFIDRNPPLRAIKTYMTNSASRDLEITLSRNEPDRDPEEEDVTDDCEAARIAAVMQLLNPHTKRWRSLSISVTHLNSIRVALMNCWGIASNLTELKLCSSASEPLDSDVLKPLLSDLETPAIYKLTLGGEFIWWASTWGGRWMKSMKAVTRLFLINSSSNRLNQKKLFSLLRQNFLLKFLRQLEINDVDLALDSGDVDPLRMEFLNKISFRLVYHHNIDQILGRQFIAPRLETLEFKPRDDDSYEGDPGLPFTNSYSTQFPKLRTFHLSDCETLDLLLPTLQRCKCLIIDNGVFDEDLEMLKAPHKGEDDTDAQWLCPKLNNLELRRPNAVNAELVREVVQMRHSAIVDASGARPVPITSLIVTDSEALDEEDRKWFQEHLASFKWTDGSS